MKREVNRERKPMGTACYERPIARVVQPLSASFLAASSEALPPEKDPALPDREW